jgi:class 3 adenylate cyclase
VAVDVESAMLALGPAGSAFFVGLVLLVVAAGLLFPFGVGATLGFSALVAAVFVTPLALGMSRSQTGLLGDQVFLLLCGTVVAVAGNHVTGKLRKSEFFAREALRTEKERSERLLLNILPRPIAERLKNGEHTIAERVKDASVLFADIVGFTPLSETMSAEALVSVLDEVFSEFDRAASLHGLEKIKTIGDAYMVAAGLPTPREDHLEAIADMALDMRRAITRVNEHRGLSLAVRIGIHSGPVVAGVIGTTKFSYDVWGDTVNTASRMESHGTPGEIQVTDRVRVRLQERYELSEPRLVNVKGKGELATCFLISKRSEEGESREGRKP